MPMKLYAHQNNYKTHKALIVAKYAGLELSVPPEAAGQPQSGKIPVLETDQGCVFTSIAIARYLSRLRRDVGLYGQNLIEGGMIDSWVEFCTHELEIPLSTWVFPLKGIFPEVPEATAQAKTDVARALGVLNNHLLHNTYMVGHQVTLADVCICCAMHDGMIALEKDKGFLAPLQNLMRWYALVTGQPEFAEVLKTKAAPATSAAASGKKGQASPKATQAPPKAAKESPKAKASSAPSKGPAGGALDEEAIKAVGDKIRVLKEKLKGEGITGKKLNDHPDVVALVNELSALKAGGGGSPAAKQEAAPAKKDNKAKAKEAPKGGAAKAEAPVDPEAERKKKLKACIKAGGKRGVEIEGAADLGGLQFFCTAIEEPDGDVDMLVECVKAMNAKSDPSEEERKGGSGHIGKMIFSAGTEQLAVAAYVPEDKQAELSCEEWLQAVLSIFGGSVSKGDKELSLGVVKTDSDKGVFPLKIREPMILEANNYLRKKGLFPEDNGDSDDDFVFGDDDFPSM